MASNKGMHYGEVEAEVEDDNGGKVRGVGEGGGGRKAHPCGEGSVE